MVLLLTGKLQKPGKLSKAPTTLEPQLGNSGLARARLRARGSRPLTLDLFQQDLQETLAPVPQTPLIFPIGLAKEAALLPGLFSDPDRAEIQERLAAILDRLLGLAPQDRVKDWQLEARPSVRGPLRVGTEFALQVRPAKAGHLVVFTVAADDSVTFLFPNRYVPQSAVEANRERAIPYPRGSGHPATGGEGDLQSLPGATRATTRSRPSRSACAAIRCRSAGSTTWSAAWRGAAYVRTSPSLRDAVGRGMAIKPAGETGTGKKQGDATRPVPWTRAVVAVQSVH